MLLKITTEMNLRTEHLLTHAGIPCVCAIGREFEVQLHAPLDSATGRIEGWDPDEIAYRAPAGAGGRLTHLAHGRITLREVSSDTYEVVDLDMFYERFGWVPVVADGAYASPLEGLWDEEE
jgi:hypothetical protein